MTSRKSIFLVVILSTLVSVLSVPHHLLQQFRNKRHGMHQSPFGVPESQFDGGDFDSSSSGLGFQSGGHSNSETMVTRGLHLRQPAGHTNGFNGDHQSHPFSFGPETHSLDDSMRGSKRRESEYNFSDGKTGSQYPFNVDFSGSQWKGLENPFNNNRHGSLMMGFPNKFLVAGINENYGGEESPSHKMMSSQENYFGAIGIDNDGVLGNEENIPFSKIFFRFGKHSPNQRRSQPKNKLAFH